MSQSQPYLFQTGTIQAPELTDDGIFRKTLYQQALSDDKSKAYIGQKVCDITLVVEDGQSQPCGVVCRSAQVLWYHKKKTTPGTKPVK
ncbi:hypothetical protein [Endozoicomonas sp. 8E]|uniref:hypothetical protein n=1 Tax=Endozoicomonas sp. 8E TaxID=3035692 RepID=UPI002938DBEC|nr:hypothetical protein [Endozoicomonas sp. 8E]WOG27127.1 hypothetical protein P6910_21630 [Endozoicomonas sp. 8E]